MNAPREMNQIICMFSELHQRSNDVLVRAAVRKFGDLYQDRLGNQSKSSFLVGGGVMLGGVVVATAVPLLGVAAFYGGFGKMYSGFAKRGARDITITSRGRKLDPSGCNSTEILQKVMSLPGGDDERSARYLFALCCLAMQKYYLHHALGMKVNSMSDREWINQYATEIHEMLQASHVSPEEVVYFFSDKHPTFNWSLINSDTLERVYTAAAQRYLTEPRPYELAVVASIRFADRAQNLQQRIAASILFPDTKKPQEVAVRIDPCLQGNALGCLEHLLQQLRCEKGNQDRSSLKGMIMDELFKLPGFTASPMNQCTPSQLSMELATHLYGPMGCKPYQLPDALPMVASLIPEINTLRLQNASISSVMNTYYSDVEAAYGSLSSDREAWYSFDN